jgi:predicted nucleic acid-binding protein
MNGKNNFLLDTNVVLSFLKNNLSINNFFQQNFSDQDLFVSQITRMELLGYKNITERDEIELNHFLSLVKILPLSDSLCDKAIYLRRNFSLKLPDALIAATAINSNLILLTCDKDLLTPIEGLQVINPCL